ncbi:hypothetical protein SAMN05518849_11692 [Sphingobium sp. AP50]|nr:hypothetical protein SAMN05518849_11692 [Sphingobium sp. AP50]
MRSARPYKYVVYLIDLFQREYDAATTTKRKTLLISRWRTSIDLTRNGKLEGETKRRQTVRYLPYWRKLTDDQLDALAGVIATFDQT